MVFTLDHSVDFEESLSCEFKEVKSNPVQAVGKVVDEYVVAFLNESGGSIYWGIRDSDRVVTGVPLPAMARDELRQVIGQKVSYIAPSIPAESIVVPFHPVLGSDGNALDQVFVLEVRVTRPKAPALFLTGGGAAYKKTLGGTKKLSGLELLTALAPQLQPKDQLPSEPSVLSQLPSVHARALLVAPLIRGRRVLWVDDQPSNTFYERVALAQLGVTVDVAVSGHEALRAVTHLRPDLILSDMERDGKNDAGLEFLRSLREQGVSTPLIYYVAQLDRATGVPDGAFAITARADALMHLVLDVLERGKQSPNPA